MENAIMDDVNTLFVTFINGIKITVDNIDPEETLLHFLRRKMRLTGTKYGCGEGSCGACTVMISDYNWKLKKINHYAINACLMPIAFVHGKAVTTVEGIGSMRTSPHPVQERIAKCHGSQCGFCSPGMTMSAYTILRNNNQPTLYDFQIGLQGNLCRCTGYRSILNALRTFTTEKRCLDNSDCCQQKSVVNEHDITGELFAINTFTPYDPSQDIIFPPELQLNDKYVTQIVKFHGPRVFWIQPINLEQLLKLKTKYPKAVLVFGNTIINLNKEKVTPLSSVAICPTRIPELYSFQQDSLGLHIGAGISISELQTTLLQTNKYLPDHQCKIFQAFADYLNRFGNRQIRNVVAIGSCVAQPLSTSDLNVLLVAANSTMEIGSLDGRRQMRVTDYISSDEKLKDDEIILSICIPFSSMNEFFICHKQSFRQYNDVAVVNSAFKVEFEDDYNQLKTIRLSYGGIGTKTILAKTIMDYIKKTTWSKIILSKALDCLCEDITNHGVNITEYKKSLAMNLFFKFYTEVNCSINSLMDAALFDELYNINKFRRQPSNNYSFQDVALGQPMQDTIGRPLMHQNASFQTTGEAIYCDDIPLMPDQLYLGFVTSTHPHADIISIDTTEALATESVIGFLDYKDIPGQNVMGMWADEEIFASQKVVTYGQLIGVIIAEDEALAKRAAKLVKVHYKELQPILTIEDAISADSYHCPPVNYGADCEDAFQQSDYVLEGELYVGAQKHLYLEPISVLAVPKSEYEEMELYLPTQDPTHTLVCASRALNIPHHKITIKVKQLGGSYGGKINNPLYAGLPALIAAHKFNRPVRYKMTREEDMIMCGTRHPFLFKYKVGSTKEGKLTALDFKGYNNGGYSLDFSEKIIFFGYYNFISIYHFPYVKFTGYALKTNIPSNNAFRGFGSPQMIIALETIMNHVAVELGISQAKIREINIFQEGMRTVYGMLFTPCSYDRCFAECLAKSNYYQREQEIKEFNRKNLWKKRGISISAVTYTLFKNEYPYNWGSALVNIYTDGSVSISHGGIEMGQGINTKMLQIASRVLKLSIDCIRITETSTDKVPNYRLTGASNTASDNGFAVEAACKILLERLEPIINSNPKGSWKDWVNAAFMNRVNLSAAFLYKAPGKSYDLSKNDAYEFSCFIMGTSCVEVEIDCLTGNHQVLRTDIVIDLGQSMNPAIDIGQVEGGFLQGYGLVSLEDWKINSNGEIICKGIRDYKIPSINDIPVEFNLHFLTGTENKRGIYSTKGPGECGLNYAACNLMAIKNAIYAARLDNGITGNFRLDSPATAEKILLACKKKII